MDVTETPTATPLETDVTRRDIETEVESVQTADAEIATVDPATEATVPR